MGCLNANEKFDHVFGNIHFSGPCNRACYFCIGQHMMALDHINSLEKELVGTRELEMFLRKCDEAGVKQINLTGSNTDPLLYKYLEDLVVHLNARDYIVGIRTNGVAWDRVTDAVRLLVDKWSFSLTSVIPKTYKKTMGMGEPPNLRAIVKSLQSKADVKINMVLCPENANEHELNAMIATASAAGIHRINIREPYGQPHIGNPFRINLGGLSGVQRLEDHKGMPVYYHQYFDVELMYWDVHYVEVDSVNLYMNGRISTDYAVSKGHSESGEVKDQSHFKQSGRIREQWVKK